MLVAWEVAKGWGRGAEKNGGVGEGLRREVGGARGGGRLTGFEKSWGKKASSTNKKHRFQY